MNEVLEVESQALTVREAQPVAPSGLFGTSDPVAIIERAGVVASALKDVIRKQGLISKISNKEYPRCEAWTLLGTMIGVFPVLEWTRKLENGFEARVAAKMLDGSVVGTAEAECTRDEKNWANRDSFALRSMAQTRATAKALRMPLGFVMTLAGYEPTPAEEMTFEREQVKQSKPAPPPSPQNSPSATPKPKVEPSDQDKADHAMFLTTLRKQMGNPDLEKHVIRYLQGTTSKKGVVMLAPWEKLEDLQLVFLKGLVNGWENAYPAIELWLQENPEDVLDLGPATAQQHPDPEFMNMIVTVPRKGTKKADYMKAPDTIRSLYENRHASEEDRRRLFGFQRWEPSGWTKDNGQVMPPSDADLKFKAAHNAFMAWYKANHADEVNKEAA